MKLRFTLSSVSSWRNTDANFNSDLFYNNIIAWFECPGDEAAKTRVEKTLLASTTLIIKEHLWA